jgi:peptidoglycan/LPS O-acetylase OafA/YrhL
MPPSNTNRRRPIQLTLLLVLGSQRELAVSRGFFLAYLAGILGIAWLSYRYFEVPARRWLRAGLGGQRAS